MGEWVADVAASPAAKCDLMEGGTRNGGGQGSRGQIASE